jgi:hypothetical protein
MAAAKHPPEQNNAKISAKRGAAKHLPDDDQRNSNDVDVTE